MPHSRSPMPDPEDQAQNALGRLYQARLDWRWNSACLVENGLRRWEAQRTARPVVRRGAKVYYRGAANRACWRPGNWMHRGRRRPEAPLMRAAGTHRATTGARTDRFAEARASSPMLAITAIHLIRLACNCSVHAWRKTAGERKDDVARALSGGTRRAGDRFPTGPNGDNNREVGQ